MICAIDTMIPESDPAREDGNRSIRANGSNVFGPFIPNPERNNHRRSLNISIIRVGLECGSGPDPPDPERNTTDMQQRRALAAHMIHELRRLCRPNLFPSRSEAIPQMKEPAMPPTCRNGDASTNANTGSQTNYYYYYYYYYHHHYTTLLLEELLLL